ncbi:hypothetical protein [Vibrio sp. 1CM24A]|uniref:hypothetical protein n=2 Tax=unclassified Vibrio TaxID=2614977 RepID=UPI0020C09CD8|nr:hypothetical protein [Vibrio sp. 1CM24A]MCK8083540.1 hypothetical protein [Vibrio sp. 1CM24A]
MTTNNLKTDFSYLVIQRKLFTRFALPYEVVLDSWCCTFESESLLSAEAARKFAHSGAFSDDLIILELGQNIQKKQAYSFSALERVIFNSNDAHEQFLERSYENFDVTSLNCMVLIKQAFDQSYANFQVEKPVNPTQKSNLVLNDGVMALTFEMIKDEAKTVSELIDLFAKEQSQKELLLSLFDPSILLKADEVEILYIFINLCFENSLDMGWNIEFILNKLHERVSEDTKREDKFQVWEVKANELFSGSGELTIPLDDDGSAILRAIILVLLNPELSNLIAIKDSFGDRIGDKVFLTAKKLVLLRAGYSLLNYEERADLGDGRVFVQDLNAALYNDELPSLISFGEILNQQVETQLLSNQVNLEDEYTSKLNISDVSFVKELGERFKGDRVYSIEGIVPNTGFKAELIEKSDGLLYFLLIDLRGDEKNSKYKGKIGIDLLQVQSALPNDFRFEVDSYGVYLRLSGSINTESDLLQALKYTCHELALVKAFNSRKSTLIK